MQPLQKAVSKATAVCRDHDAERGQRLPQSSDERHEERPSKEGIPARKEDVAHVE
jgi:hypothetical protein